MERRTYWVCRNTQCSVLGRWKEPEAAQANYRCRCQSRLEMDTADTLTNCPSIWLDRLAWPLAASSAVAIIAFNCYLRRGSLWPELLTFRVLLVLLFLMCILRGYYSHIKMRLREEQLQTPAPMFERDDIACKAFLASYGLFFAVSILQPLWFYGT